MQRGERAAQPQPERGAGAPTADRRPCACGDAPPAAAPRGRRCRGTADSRLGRAGRLRARARPAAERAHARAGPTCPGATRPAPAGSSTASSGRADRRGPCVPAAVTGPREQRRRRRRRPDRARRSRRTGPSRPRPGRAARRRPGGRERRHAARRSIMGPSSPVTTSTTGTSGACRAALRRTRRGRCRSAPRPAAGGVPRRPARRPTRP